MFGHNCAIVGVIHVAALPGAAAYCGTMSTVIERAISDADAYIQGGVHALIIENMHDVPYLNGYVEPETTAAMAVVAQAIKQEIKTIPLGIQILAAANIEALAVAIAAGLDFMRVEGYVFAHVGDEGIHQASAPKLIRRRAALRGEHVKVFADIKKKHSAHSITSDISLVETAEAAQFFCADGVIVTGAATGIAPASADVARVRSSVKTSVLVGSGITPENVKDFAPHADALIVGSALKFEGHWSNPVDTARVKTLMQALT